MNERELSQEERNSIAYFGGCPHCGGSDGFINVGRSHWFVCHEHKIKWCIGSNLFSGWREQTEDQQRSICDKHGVGEYREITCEEASRHPLVQQWACDLEQNSEQNGGAILASEPVEPLLWLPPPPFVTLSDDGIDRCFDYATSAVEHFRANGDRITAMPWTRDKLNDDDLREWLASRKDAASKIDIETCELGRWPAYDCDPYGVRPDLPDEMKQVGTNRFVRSPDSNGWVHEGDLPTPKAFAMYERIHREAAEREPAHKPSPPPQRSLLVRAWSWLRVLLDVRVALARRRGYRDRRAGVRRSGVPVEWRSADRRREALAWCEGWNKAHKEMPALPPVELPF